MTKPAICSYMLSGIYFHVLHLISSASFGILQTAFDDLVKNSSAALRCIRSLGEHI